MGNERLLVAGAPVTAEAQDPDTTPVDVLEALEEIRELDPEGHAQLMRVIVATGHRVRMSRPRVRQSA